LFAAKLALAHLESLAKNSMGLVPVVAELAELVTKCMTATRQIANDLRPESLSHGGLESTLRSHAAYFSELSLLTIQVHVPNPLPELDEDARLILFRTAQEALTNAAKHAAAKSVDITLDYAAGCVRLVVADDGRGLAPGALQKDRSLGLLGLRERLAARGGDVVVTTNSPTGTVLTASLPVAAG
jgi:signal transduction histidine kinase